MKMTKSLFLAFAGLGLFACSNEEVTTENGFVDNGKTQSMVISLSGLSDGSRSTDNPQGAVTATFTNVAIYYTDNSGNVGHVTTIANDDPEWADLTTAGKGYVEHNLSAAITQVHVVCNYDVLGDLKQIGTTGKLKEKVLDAANQQTFGSVLLFGEDTDGLDEVAEGDGESGHKVVKAVVSVKPLVSRLEVSNITCTDLGNQYSSIDLKQIGLMNFYTTVSVSGNKDGLKEAPETAAEWISPDFPAWSFDEITGATITDNTPWNPETSKVFVYNIVPNEQSNPLEVRLLVDAKRAGTVDPFNTTLVGKINKDLEAGKIYQMTYSFKEENIGPWNPDDVQCVQVEVKVHEWQVEALTPTFE